MYPLTKANTTVNKSIKRAGNQRSVFEKASGTKLSKTKDADHLIDLQLNGKDAASNLWGLDNSVNRSLGKQIGNAIKDLPHGTKIDNVTIK